jgi:uncharacterized protein YoxC
MIGALANFFSNQFKYKSSFKDYEDLIDRSKSGDITLDREKFEKAINEDPRFLDHYTPNPFASLIVNSISKSPKKVLDPCCGLANILYCLSQSVHEADLTGVEINKGVSLLAKYLVPESDIVNSDFFQFFPNTKYNLIVGTLPSGTRINLNGKKMKIENAFVTRAIELLEKEGEAFFLTSYNFMSNYSNSDEKNIIVPHVNSVTTLPKLKGSKSNLRTYLIHLTKAETESISFGSVQNFLNLKPKLVENLQLTIPKSQLEDRLQPEYYISRRSDKYDFLDEFETKNLGEFAQIIKGVYIKKEEKKSKGKFLILKPSEIKTDKIEITNSSGFLNAIEDPRHLKAVAQPGDILISTFFNQSKIYVVKENDPAILVSNSMVILRSSDTEYLQVYLETEEGKNIFNLQAEDLATGSVIPSLSISNLKKIQIPIVPLDNPNRLGNKSLEFADRRELEDLKAQVEFYKNELAQKDQTLKIYKGFKEILENRDNKIIEELQKVNKKLDTILQELKNLQDDFKMIKQSNRDNEEKILRLLSSMDRRIKTVLDEKRETIEEYEEITKKWLIYWDELHPSSKEFLPLAEYLYDELCRLQDPDFSPFILQYCRTLENEILSKLFQYYHEEGLINEEIQELTAFDVSNRTKAMKFAQNIRRNNCKYPLGDMHWILNLLKPSGTTYKKSPLLQHFQKFLSQYFQEELTSQAFLDQVQRIQKDYRNEAAHVSTLDLKSADECRDLLRDSLSRFLELRN